MFSRRGLTWRLAQESFDARVSSCGRSQGGRKGEEGVGKYENMRTMEDMKNIQNRVRHSNHCFGEEEGRGGDEEEEEHDAGKELGYLDSK